jgi:hypothetical protein
MSRTLINIYVTGHSVFAVPAVILFTSSDASSPCHHILHHYFTKQYQLTIFILTFDFVVPC